MAIISDQAAYHAAAVATGLPQPHSANENYSDAVALALATSYGVTEKSLANLQANFDASSVLNSLDPLTNPILMNQAEYIRQITNNATAYGSQQAYAANAYFGTGIATTFNQAVAGISKALGISQDAAASFAGGNPAAITKSAVVTTTTQPVIDTSGTKTGGAGGSGGASTTATGTNWIGILTGLALPVLLVGIIGYLLYAGLTGKHHGHRSAA